MAVEHEVKKTCFFSLDSSCKNEKKINTNLIHKALVQHHTI